MQYEFTDPIEDIIPVATKVDFLGIQGAYKTSHLLPDNCHDPGFRQSYGTTGSRHYI